MNGFGKNALEASIEYGRTFSLYLTGGVSDDRYTVFGKGPRARISANPNRPKSHSTEKDGAQYHLVVDLVQVPPNLGLTAVRGKGEPRPEESRVYRGARSPQNDGSPIPFVGSQERNRRRRIQRSLRLGR